MTQHLCTGLFTGRHGIRLKVWRDGTARECVFCGDAGPVVKAKRLRES